MPTVSIRVDEELLDLIEEAAAAADVSVSEWARQTFMSDLGTAERPDWTAPRSLSKPQRHQLSMLHHLRSESAEDEDEADHHRQMVRVLQEGFSGEYDDVFVGIDEEISYEDCQLTWDILDMFMVIEFSIEKIGPESVQQLDDHAEGFLRFRGFDGNDGRESKIGSYAGFLVATGRWEDLAHHFSNTRFPNSHSQTLSSYVRMVTEYKSIMSEHTLGTRIGSGLNEEELTRIIRAAYHPSRRPDQ